MKSKILITGGTGFLGINLARKLKKKYKVFLGARNNKQNFEASKKTGCEVIPLDVTNINSIKDAINYSEANIIIHAAATKFVDLSEKYPFETIDTNVIGSTNIARVAIDKKIQTVIGISTDKASPPVKNIYGLSKTMMEKVFISADKNHKTDFACVRYGNVAWSTGSVLPIWNEMFKKDKLIYSTGPYMRRFFFTVDEAVKLVITALDNIKLFKGKILSREMKSAMMIDILKTWIKIYGGKYKLISNRSGDRNDEYLIGEAELEFTKKIKIGGVIHYVIDFDKKVKTPLKKIISSSNSKRLSQKDIEFLIRLNENYLT
jgi:FlaA1/EpsC-like NDP-sugar epimerase